MSEPSPPKIEFPCPDYPIIVMGKNEPGFLEAVINITQQFDSQLDVKKITTNTSRNGRFLSVRMKIVADSPEQLELLHVELRNDSRVKMVL